MGKKFIIIAFLLIQALSLSVNYDSMARPARTGKIAFMQPDGSSFVGSITGDEFFRLKMTETGESIIRDEDGWWCYAYFDSEGRRFSSGVKVGTNDAAAKSASRNIPYSFLMQKASERRRIFEGEFQKRREYFKSHSVFTKAGGTPTVKHGIIILAAFSDVPFTYTKAEIEAMVCQAGYTNSSGAPGSAKDYFDAQFGGLYELEFEVSDIVTLPKKRSYYGENDSNGDLHPDEMVSDACKLAYKNGVRFAKYDYDGDGEVDTVFVIFAGEDEAETGNDDCIWDHSWVVSDKPTIDGVRIYTYACASELGVEFNSQGNITGKYLARIGTFCHEYSHTFGLADLYDTDYSDNNGTSEALWVSTGLMDGGNMNNKGFNPPNWNAVDRMQLKIGNCMELTPGQHNLRPINENGDYYRLESGTEGEFFLIECRSNQNEWDKYIGGSGLLVYHIDQTKTSVWNYYNSVNANPTHQYADLIEPTKGMRSSYLYQGDFSFNPINYTPHYNALNTLFWPYSTKTSLDASYAFSTWYGTTVGVKVENIRLESDGSISFTVSESDEGSGESSGNTQSKFLAIKLNYASRSEDGSFAAGTKIPLKIINGQNIEETKWFFNTKPVTLDENSKWTITQSGELKAEVYFSDGNKTIIYKEITVK